MVHADAPLGPEQFIFMLCLCAGQHIIAQGLAVQA